MNAVYLIAGAGILTLTVYDAIRTTLSGHGAGPLTRPISRTVWQSAMAWHRRRQAHRLLAWMGPFILSLSVLMWVILIWLGWLLVFLSSADNVVASQTRTPAGLWEKAYFVGFSAYTLGVGDFVPSGAVWRILTVIATISGFLMITQAITYSLSVISAATQQRQLAGLIAGLGPSPAGIVEASWTGSGFEGIDQHLAQMCTLIELHAQRHLSYPILHYFHSMNPSTSIAPQIAVLYEALLLLSSFPEQVRLPRQVWQPPRRAVEDLLRVLEADFVHPSPQVPSAPKTEALVVRGLQLDERAMAERLAHHERFRRLLLSYVSDSGWGWELVESAR
jgi:uncharacterized membrane protein